MVKTFSRRSFLAAGTARSRQRNAGLIARDPRAEVLQLGVERARRFDIAGAEAGFPPTRHLDAFEYLRRENAHFTIHAGEGFGLPSIWEALQWCGADRLGHGVRIVDDIAVTPDGVTTLGRLAAYVRDMRIPLEMAPTSNVQTGAAASIAGPNTLNAATWKALSIGSSASVPIFRFCRLT